MKRTEIELIAEQYNKVLIEEGLLDFFKSFTKRLFSRTKDKYEGFDEELIEDLANRLRDGGPRAIEAFLEELKKSGGEEFEGVLTQSIKKISQALKYGVDAAVDAVSGLIYEIVDGLFAPQVGEADYRQIGRDRYTDSSHVHDLDNYDVWTGAPVNAEGEEDHDKVLAYDPPRKVLREMERHLVSMLTNKSFGFSAEMSLEMAERAIELAEKLKRSLESH